MSPDDSDTDSGGSSKNKRPRKQSKGKSQLEKTVKRQCSIHEDKWGLGEYRLWATALVNWRRCKHEPFSILYFYEVSTCIILNFRAFNFFFWRWTKKAEWRNVYWILVRCRGAKCVLSVRWNGFMKIYSTVSFPSYFLALIQCNVHFYRKGDITTVMKSHQTILCSQILPRNKPKALQSLHKHWLKYHLRSWKAADPTYLPMLNR